MKKLNVMDATAIALCRDYSMPVIVFNMNKTGSLMRIMRGENEGTIRKVKIYVHGRPIQE